MSTHLPPPDGDDSGIQPLPYPGEKPVVAPVTPVPLAAPTPAEAMIVPAEEEEEAMAVLAEVEEEAEEVPEESLIHTPALSAEPLDLTVIDSSSHNKEKAAAVALAVVVHVALALLLGVLVVVVPAPPASEITAIAAPAATLDQLPTTQKIAEQPPPQSVSQLTTSMRFVTASGTSAMPMPAVEFDPAATTLDLGTTLGSFDANFAGAGSGTGSVVMFGKELKNVRKIAVVMDVSRSMTRYLPEVVKELKKVGRDSALILYFGCWMGPIDTRKLETVHPAGGPEFDKFWQYWQGRMDMQQIMKDYKNLRYDPKLPMPLEDVYKQVAKRKDTYFIDRDGSRTSVYSALMAKEIRDADTIYWFADFMDRIDDDMAADFFKKMRSRQRKLYIHAPHNRGTYLQKVTDTLVKPLGGEAIILDIKT